MATKKKQGQVEARRRQGNPWKKKAKRARPPPRRPRHALKAGEEARRARRTTSQTSAYTDEPPSPAKAVAPETTDSADRPTSMPDESWTVVRLRAKARTRGLTGMSGKSKTGLLAALT